MKKTLLSAALAACVAFGAAAEVASTLYLIGEPAGGWDTSKGIEMTKTAEGVFETDVTLLGKNSFGFVKELNSNGDWTAFNSCRYTPAEAGTVPEIGDNDMFYTGDDTDHSWDLGAGNYHFKVDTNTMKFILSDGGGDVPPTPEVTYYFVGDANNWTFLDAYIMTAGEDGVYTYSAPTIRGGVPFKLSDRDWKLSWTSKDEAMTTGTYDVVTGDALPNMAFAEDLENAELILDTKAGKLTVKGNMAGVTDILTDADASAEYFNMQGVRVASPAPGLYLVRRAGKITKEVLR